MVLPPAPWPWLRCVGEWALALGVAVALYLASGVLQPAGHQCVGMGPHYEALSRDPFALQCQLPHRLLGPLLAWLLGLGGPRYAEFCHGTNVFLIASLWAWCRHRGAGLLDALLTTAAVTATGTVLLYRGLLGYSDATTFALLLVAQMVARSSLAFWAVLLLSLVNHDQVLMFFPWALCWRRRRVGGPWRRDLLGLAAALLLYVAFRWWVAAHAPAQKLTVGFYLFTGLLPWGTAGLFALTVADAALVFGPLLPALGYRAARRDPDRDPLLLLLYLLGIAAIQFVAFDFHRFVNFLFLPLAEALLAAARRGTAHRLAVAAAVVATAFVYTTWNERVALQIAIAIAQCQALEQPWNFGLVVVPQNAGLVSGLAAATVALLAAGYWLGRRCERRAVPTRELGAPG